LMHTSDQNLTDMGKKTSFHAPKVYQLLKEKVENGAETVTMYCSPAIRALETLYGITWKFRKHYPEIGITVKFLWGMKSKSSMFNLKFEPEEVDKNIEYLIERHRAALQFMEKDCQPCNELKTGLNFDYSRIKEDLENGATDGNKNIWREGVCYM